MRSYSATVGTVVKKSLSFRADLYAAVEAEARADGSTPSAAFAEAATLWLATRRGVRAVRSWEAEHGALPPEELAEADRVLDEAGVGLEVPRH
jgi:hypothetical protein